MQFFCRLVAVFSLPTLLVACATTNYQVEPQFKSPEVSERAYRHQVREGCVVVEELSSRIPINWSGQCKNSRVEGCGVLSYAGVSHTGCYVAGKREGRFVTVIQFGNGTSTAPIEGMYSRGIVNPSTVRVSAPPAAVSSPPSAAVRVDAARAQPPATVAARPVVGPSPSTSAIPQRMADDPKVLGGGAASK